MFKSNHIWQFLGAVIIGIGFLSCDGRISADQALKEDIESFKKKINIQIDEYYPNGDFSHEIDTLLSTGHRLSIKTITDPINEVILTSIKDSINVQKHYKHFIFSVAWTKSQDGREFKEQFNIHKVLELVEKNQISIVPTYDMVLKGINVNALESSDHYCVLDLMSLPVLYQKKAIEYQKEK